MSKQGHTPGPPDAPVMVEVVTTYADGSTARKIVNHDDRDDRVWLGKHCFWAFRNGATIVTRAAIAKATGGED